MSAVVASVRDGRRAFGARRVLDGVDLELRAGEFVAVLGRSGSGKTTLLRMLAGLDREAGGDIRVSVARTLMFQDASLLPWLRVLDNVALGLAAADVDLAGEALAEVGLAGRERSWPSSLSGGEAQRVALARALVRRPEVLLLDEPFGSLDAITRVQMHQLLRRLHEVHQPATLLVTHDIDEALALADRVLVLADGRFTVDLAVSRPPASTGLERGEPADLRPVLLSALGVGGERPRLTEE